MKQEEIWINHIKNTDVKDVINEYHNPAHFQRELADLIKNNSGCGNFNVIEVGCELGVTSLLLPDKYNKTLLDLNPLAIDLVKKSHKELNKEATFLVADMFNMPIEDGKYHIVFNAGVIEHFNESERECAFKEYRRILKSNGIMYIAFPNHYSFPYRAAYIIRRFFNKWPYPEEFKIFDLKKEIDNAGLQLERRVTLSKKSLMKWLDFIPPLKWLLQLIDKTYNFEGYLTTLIIKVKK